MILVFAAILVNGFILGTLISLLNMLYPFIPGLIPRMAFLLPFLKLFGVARITPNIVALSITGAILFICIVIALSPAGDVVVKFGYNFRQPLRDERERMKRLFKQVCEKAGKHPKSFKLYAIDSRDINGYAFGFNAIVISRGMLRSCQDDAILAVMAHEMGHLHYGDCTKFRVFATVCMIGQTVFLIYQWLSLTCEFFGRLPIPLLNLAFLIGSLWFRLQLWILNGILAFSLWIASMFGSRQNEYRADRYACEIGYSEEMHQLLLYLLDYGPIQETGFLSLLKKSHPSHGHRIKRIEDWQDRQDGKLVKTGLFSWL